MIDYHIHTSLSDDSDTPWQEMTDMAIRLGLKEVAITDHHDPSYPDPNFPFDLNFDAYHMMLEDAIQHNSKMLKVRRGMELGINDSCFHLCRDAAKNYHYDFIIGSFHMTNGVVVDAKEFYEDRSGLEIQEEYYSYALKCVKEFKDYSVIGHLNLVDRYQHLFRPEEPLCPPEMGDLIHDILETVTYDGKGIEFNTSSFRYKTPVTMPTPEIWKLYKELGGEIITLGSDAHTPEYIAYDFRSALEILESIGFKYIATFNEMKPDFIKISHL